MTWKFPEKVFLKKKQDADRDSETQLSEKTIPNYKLVYELVYVIWSTFDLNIC